MLCERIFLADDGPDRALIDELRDLRQHILEVFRAAGIVEVTANDDQLLDPCRIQLELLQSADHPPSRSRTDSGDAVYFICEPQPFPSCEPRRGCLAYCSFLRGTHTRTVEGWTDAAESIPSMAWSTSPGR